MDMSPAEVYVSVVAGFRGHPKVRKLCRLMRTELAHAYIVGLWDWAAQNSPDGDLAAFDVEEIEDGSGYSKCDGRLYRALVAAAFVDEVDDHGEACRRLHNWMRAGRSGYGIQRLQEDRARWREKKTGQRSQHRDVPRDIPGDVPQDEAGTSNGHGRDVPGRSRAFTGSRVHGFTGTQEKEEEESENPPGSSAAPAAPAPADDSPVHTRIPMTGGRGCPLTEAEMARLRNLYPGVDLEYQLRRLVDWLDRNPKRQNANARGVRNRIAHWMTTEQERASRGGGFKSPEGSRAPTAPRGHVPASSDAHDRAGDLTGELAR